MTKEKILLTVSQTAVLMAILTLGSKLLGFIREMVMANYYGTSYITDSYVMANAIPGILFGGIVTSVSTAYMPVFSKIYEIKGQKEANKYTSAIINILLTFGVVSSTIGLLFSNQIVKIFAFGFKGEAAELTSFFLKITFFYVLFTAIIGILDSYLKYRGVFITQVIIGYSQSLFLILFIVLSAHTKHQYIIFGYACAYIFQAIVYMAIAKHRDYKYELTFDSGGHTFQILQLAMPVFIVSLVNQLGQFVDKTLASTLPEGSVAALNYGILLTALISGLTITIMATIIYPKLNQLYTLKNYDKFNEILGKGVVVAIIITIPCALGVVVYSQQIVQVVYERGAFDPAGTKLTAIALWCYAVGLPFNSVNVLLANAFISMHNTKTPAIISCIVVIVDIILNFILIKPMAHGGLALSTSIGAMVGTVLYYVMFKKSFIRITSIINMRTILRLLFMSSISVGISWIFYKYAILPQASIIYSRTLQLMITVGIAVILYYFMLKLFKFEEINIVKEIFKINRKKR